MANNTEHIEVDEDIQPVEYDQDTEPIDVDEDIRHFLGLFELDDEDIRHLFGLFDLDEELDPEFEDVINQEEIDQADRDHARAVDEAYEREQEAHV